MNWPMCLETPLAGRQSRKRRRWRALYPYWRIGTGSGCEVGGKIAFRMNLSIVIPVYRGEAFIEPLVLRMQDALPKFAQTYEVIFVNDGSPDNSWAVIEKLARQYSWIKG